MSAGPSPARARSTPRERGRDLVGSVPSRVMPGMRSPRLVGERDAMVPTASTTPSDCSAHRTRQAASAPRTGDRLVPLTERRAPSPMNTARRGAEARARTPGRTPRSSRPDAESAAGADAVVRSPCARPCRSSEGQPCICAASTVRTISGSGRIAMTRPISRSSARSRRRASSGLAVALAAPHPDTGREIASAPAIGILTWIPPRRIGLRRW